MFDDKGPLDRRDPPRLAAKKLMRQASALPPVVFGGRLFTRLVEKYFPQWPHLGTLYNWAIGVAVLQGYRQGLQDQARPPQGVMRLEPTGEG